MKNNVRDKWLLTNGEDDMDYLIRLLTNFLYLMPIMILIIALGVWVSTPSRKKGEKV